MEFIIIVAIVAGFTLLFGGDVPYSFGSWLLSALVLGAMGTIAVAAAVAGDNHI